MESNFKTQIQIMKKGFTLIELLVVVLIMGILASVALPQYYKSVEKSRSAEAIAILSGLASSYERFCMKSSPANLNGFLSEVDIGMKPTYFSQPTATKIMNGLRFEIKRNTTAGGGLGSYTITLSFKPLVGQKTWLCAPNSAGCRSFLPK